MQSEVIVKFYVIDKMSPQLNVIIEGLEIFTNALQLVRDLDQWENEGGQ